MSMTATRTRTVRLHCHGGIIWSGSDEFEARRTLLVADDAANVPELELADVVRVPGSRDNARLIRRLYHLSGREFRLQLAGPEQCRVSAQTTPAETLAAMQQVTSPPSMGGWHEPTTKQVLQYTLVDAVDTFGIAASQTRKALLNHPAWPSLAFIHNLDHAAAAFVLAGIVDPRWFSHASKPERISKLKQWFRVTRWTVAAAMEDYPHHPLTSDRMIQLLRVWALPGQPELSELSLPGNFFWRQVVSKNLRSAEEETWRGYRHALLRFLVYLRDAWLDSISSAELFVPEYYFDTPGEAESWRLHIKEFRRANPSEGQTGSPEEPGGGGSIRPGDPPAADAGADG